jgi:hypothetical protein
MQFSTRLALTIGATALAGLLAGCTPGASTPATGKPAQTLAPKQTTSPPQAQPQPTTPDTHVGYTVKLSCDPRLVCGEVVKATQIGDGCRFELGAPFAGQLATIKNTPCPPHLHAFFDLNVAAKGGDIRHLVPVRITSLKYVPATNIRGCVVNGKYADPFWGKLYDGRNPGAVVDSVSECDKLRPGMVAAVPINWAFDLRDEAAETHDNSAKA